VLEIASPGVGISRKLLHKYIHALEEAYGFDITSMYTCQRATRVDMLVSHWKENSTIERLLQASMEISIVEVGLADNSLNQEYERWEENATPCWITSAWQFMSEYNIHMNIDIPTIEMRR